MDHDLSVGREINKMGRDRKERKEKYAGENKVNNINNFNYCTALVHHRWPTLISPMKAVFTNQTQWYIL